MKIPKRRTLSFKLLKLRHSKFETLAKDLIQLFDLCIFKDRALFSLALWFSRGFSTIWYIKSNIFFFSVFFPLAGVCKLFSKLTSTAYGMFITNRMENQRNNNQNHFGWNSFIIFCFNFVHLTKERKKKDKKESNVHNLETYLYIICKC